MGKRLYVRVSAETDETGQITPFLLILRGVKLPIDRVLDRRQAHATKAGGQGMRYTVRIGKNQAYLFQDDAQRWFVEEDDDVRQVPHYDGG
jgi:hypothetical protein